MGSLGEVSGMCSNGDKLWECIYAESPLKLCVFRETCSLPQCRQGIRGKHVPCPSVDRTSEVSMLLVPV